MKTWIKYGLIGAGIYLLIAIIGWFFKTTFFSILLLPISLIFGYLLMIPGFIFLIAIILGFIIGAIIGLIVGKIRGENDK